MRFSSRVVGWIQPALLGISVLLCVALSVCYSFRFDAVAAVTLWPPWVWLAPGLLLAALAWSRSRRRLVVAALFLWLLFLLAFAEEPRSLLRLGPWPAPEWKAARQQGQALRVVSLNCAGGSAEAAAEVAAYHPDLVLLQESPVQREVEALARRLFGENAGVVWGPDGSIISHGRVTPRLLPNSLRICFSQAHVRFTSGIETEVISLRLLPPVVAIKLWSPGCWRQQTENRRARAAQVRTLARQIETLPRAAPLIIGGDFNAPAGDRIYRLLPPRLHDTFLEGGKGWGNTALNDLPMVRIDEVWASEHFRAVAVIARKTQYSDHRLVVCDLVARGGLTR